MIASPASPVSPATRTTPRYTERFDLTPWLELLETGDNLLSIALLNAGRASSDFSLVAELGTVQPVLHTNFRLSSGGRNALVVEPRP